MCFPRPVGGNLQVYTSQKTTGNQHHKILQQKWAYVDFFKIQQVNPDELAYSQVVIFGIRFPLTKATTVFWGYRIDFPGILLGQILAFFGSHFGKILLCVCFFLDYKSSKHIKKHLLKPWTSMDERLLIEGSFSQVLLFFVSYIGGGARSCPSRVPPHIQKHILRNTFPDKQFNQGESKGQPLKLPFPPPPPPKKKNKHNKLK